LLDLLQSSEIKLIGLLVVDSFHNDPNPFFDYFLQNTVYNILPNIFLKQLIGNFLIQWLNQLKFLNPFIDDEQFPPIQSLLVDGLGAYPFKLLVHCLDETLIEKEFKRIAKVEPESDLRTVKK
jgi:hypothetical protein